MKQSLIDYKARVEYQIKMGIKNRLQKKEIILRMQTEGLIVTETTYNQALKRVIALMMVKNK